MSPALHFKTVGAAMVWSHAWLELNELNGNWRIAGFLSCIASSYFMSLTDPYFFDNPHRCKTIENLPLDIPVAFR